MKRFFATFLSIIICMSSFSQDNVFKTKLYNKEYDIQLVLNLYAESIYLPGQDILGKTYGYLKNTTDSRAWAIVGVKLDKKGTKANVEIVNDYGSEDLEAEITHNEDGTYTLRQLSGSTIKLVKNKKWQKLPSVLNFEQK